MTTPIKNNVIRNYEIIMESDDNNKFIVTILENTIDSFYVINQKWYHDKKHANRYYAAMTNRYTAKAGQ